jgi:RimJ/RimL family protein N-acetyltransferase
MQPIVAGPSTEPRLTDGVVVLRPWRTDDAPAVFEACQDPEIARWTNIPQPYGLAHAEGFIAASHTAWREETDARFAITEVHTGRLLGSMSREPLEGHIASFGYWLAPEARGQGAATRALRLIADWTLAATDAIRLEAYTDAGNDASGRVLERAGFVREGVRRAWDLDRQGGPIDSVFYIRLRETSSAEVVATPGLSSVRPTGPDDFESVASLGREVQRLHAERLPDLFKAPSDLTTTRAAFDEWLADPTGLALVALEGEQVVGYLQGIVLVRDETPYRNARATFYVNQLCVARAAVPRGHGRRLLAAAAEHARQLGLGSMELDTWAFNSDARSFFEAEGFRETNLRTARGLSKP